MTLGELISFLEPLHPDLIVPLGFGCPSSHRDYYHELAFEPEKNISVREMLSYAKSSVGSDFNGYKGGTYRMTLETPVHMCYSGSTTDYLAEAFFLLLARIGALGSRILVKPSDPESW